MSEADSTLKEWFHLKYDNYTLTPKYNEEHRKFFARRNIKDNNIENHLKIFDRDLTAGITPKRLYNSILLLIRKNQFPNILNILLHRIHQNSYRICTQPLNLNQNQYHQLHM